MSCSAAPDVLVIRNLPDLLDVNDLRELLSKFGAIDVRKESSQRSSARNGSVLAKFRCHEDSQYALHRLHQLEVAGKRLVVKYANFTFLPDVSRIDAGLIPNRLGSHDEPATKSVVLKIAQLLIQNPLFYKRVWELIRVMRLELPEESLLSGEIEEVEMEELYKEETETEESELESDDESRCPALTFIQPADVTKPVSKRLKKRPRLSALFNGKPWQDKADKPRLPVEEVFDRQGSDALRRPGVSIKLKETPESSRMETLETGEGFGKFAPSAAAGDEFLHAGPTSPTPEERGEFITKNALLSGRMPVAELNLLPALKNYSPGDPSSRLYVKNLAKQVREEDLKFIYGRYVLWTSDEECNAFDVRLMTEGRMKGQAFITLPSISRAQEALGDTHGYVIHGKPLVVQFARSAKPKQTSS